MTTNAITEQEAKSFATTCRAANAAKHASFLRPRPAPSSDLELPMLDGSKNDDPVLSSAENVSSYAKAKMLSDRELLLEDVHRILKEANDRELLLKAETRDLLYDNQCLNETLSEWKTSWWLMDENEAQLLTTIADLKAENASLKKSVGARLGV